jgi:hypothetical protein
MNSKYLQHDGIKYLELLVSWTFLFVHSASLALNSNEAPFSGLRRCVTGCSVMTPRHWVFGYDAASLGVRLWRRVTGCSVMMLRHWVFGYDAASLGVWLWRCVTGCSVMTLRHWVFGSRRFETAQLSHKVETKLLEDETTALSRNVGKLKSLKDETTTLSRNVRNHIFRAAASHLRRTDTSSTPLRKPQISCN